MKHLRHLNKKNGKNLTSYKKLKYNKIQFGHLAKFRTIEVSIDIKGLFGFCWGSTYFTKTENFAKSTLDKGKNQLKQCCEILKYSQVYESYRSIVWQINPNLV